MQSSALKLAKPPPQCSPERERLAAAIEARDAAQQALDAAQRAVTRG
jgi:hypothetical protein